MGFVVIVMYIMRAGFRNRIGQSREFEIWILEEGRGEEEEEEKKVRGSL
jgi:hypothetical protein